MISLCPNQDRQPQHPIFNKKINLILSRNWSPIAKVYNFFESLKMLGNKITYQGVIS